jgi:hypothetical protein
LIDYIDAGLENVNYTRGEKIRISPRYVRIVYIYAGYSSLDSVGNVEDGGIITGVGLDSSMMVAVSWTSRHNVCEMFGIVL